MSDELTTIAEKLAGNVAKHPSDDGSIAIRLSGFYYDKYNCYSVGYSVNGSCATLHLCDVILKSNDIFPEFREPHRLAIVELDRMLKTHYQMEDLLREALPTVEKELSDKIHAALDAKGNEK